MGRNLLRLLLLGEENEIRRDLERQQTNLLQQNYFYRVLEPEILYTIYPVPVDINFLAHCIGGQRLPKTRSSDTIN